MQKTNETVVECWYNPLDAEGNYAFCAANSDAIDHICQLFALPLDDEGRVNISSIVRPKGGDRMTELTPEDVIDILRERLQLCGGSQETLAYLLGISPQYLSDILRHRREPGAKVLRPLGLRKRITYIRPKGEYET